MDKTEFSSLFQKWLGDDCSPEEVDRLLSSLAQKEDEDDWMASIENILQNRPLHGLSDTERKRVVLQKILSGMQDVQTPVYSLPKRMKWIRLAAASVIALMLTTGVYYFTHHSKPGQELPAASRYKNDVEPGGNKAILTLANGSKIMLDSAINGVLARQGSAKAVKADSGSLVYEPVAGGGMQADLVFNTLATPRGGEYQLTLSDGSRVWLNAASSIKYPIAFAGNERLVEITGEAYFEVQHNSKMPFRVKAGGIMVEDVGTQFNINAYGDEPVLKTTLVEGAVNISSDMQKGIALHPGNQAWADANGDIQVKTGIDVEEAVAWKNGVFDFRDASIETIMRQLARWYDLDLKYETRVSQHFMGKIYRNSNLSQVLRMLELVGGVHFNIEGKQVTITK